MEVVDSNEREMPAGRRNTEDFSAVRALQAPARCGPARVRHYIFDGVLLIGSGLMVPHQELFVTLQTLLAFSVIGWVKDELRRQNLICHLARFREVVSTGVCKSPAVAC